MRLIVLLSITLASCTQLETTEPISDHVTAVPLPTVSICPEGSDCPDFLPCDELDETACLSRSDCEAVYDPPASTAPKFVACRDKTGPVCRKEGESCSPVIGPDDTKTCCAGLYCCATNISGTTSACFGACPVGPL